MFKKKPAIRALAPLRSSDRRKLADKIIKDYDIPTPASTISEVDADPGDAADPSKPTLSHIRNTLFPENTQSAKLKTTAGPNLEIVSGVVYIGSPTGEEQRILWWKIDEKMYPTVYTLWRNPGIVPLLHTPDMVLQKLRGGADLMTPGLAGPPFPRGAAKGSVVAVASLEKPSVPMVVGVCEIDISALITARGEKGRAVRGMHWAGDELWSFSVGGQPGTLAAESIEGWGSELVGLDTKMGQLEIDEKTVSEVGVESVHEADGSPPPQPERNQFVEGEDGSLFERVDVADNPLSTKEIDEAFRQAFLYGVQHHLKTNKAANHGLQFPLTSSLVMADLILPFLPMHTPAQSASLQIKKSSWKNVKKFIKILEKEGLLKSKDRNGGETVIIDINFSDTAITEFRPYPLPRRDASGATRPSDTLAESAGDSAGEPKLRRLAFYKPKEKMAPIFEASSKNVRGLFSASELRTAIVGYLESESLIQPTNKRLVKLNPLLANSVFTSDKTLDREVVAKGSVPRDTLVERILQSCAPYWAIVRDPETTEDLRPRAGPLPTIHITLETRSGNKAVTKVSGVEAYHVAVQALADELQKTCASSTSVAPLMGSSPKLSLMEIMVQGSQTPAVMKALETRGIKKEWVEVLDKTKKSKR